MWGMLNFVDCEGIMKGKLFRHRQIGATGTEIGLLIGLISILLIGSITGVGQNLSSIFGDVNKTLGASASNMVEGDVGNQAPYISSVSAQTAEGGRTETFTVSVGDPDEAAEALTVSVISDDGHISNLNVSGTGATRTISYRPDAEEGAFSLTVTVTDSELLATSIQVDIASVKPVVANCEEAYVLGWTDDGSYLLDPEGDGSSTAFTCLMSEQGGGWTLIDTTSASGLRVFSQSVDDGGLSYSALYMVTDTSQILDYDNTNSAVWTAHAFPEDRLILQFSQSGSPLSGFFPNAASNICGTISGASTTLSITPIETASSSLCQNSSIGQTYCHTKMVVSVPSGATLTGVTDKESAASCSTSDDEFTLNYKIYVR